MKARAVDYLRDFGSCSYYMKTTLRFLKPVVLKLFKTDSVQMGKRSPCHGSVSTLSRVNLDSRGTHFENHSCGTTMNTVWFGFGHPPHYRGQMVLGEWIVLAKEMSAEMSVA